MIVTPASIFSVVPAAGVGARMGSDRPKQYMKIAGKTVIEHSVEALLSDTRIQAIAVSIADGDPYWSDLQLNQDSRVITAAGGATRAHSVLNGLSALADVAQPHDWVLVHDAARPCLSIDALSRLIDQVEHHHSGGILATPARDTLKLADSEKGPLHVSATLDRSLIWRAQTPQMFRYGLLERALSTGIRSGVPVTDEASAMEAASHSVLLVPGEQRNLKITTPDDIQIAEALLQSGGEKTVQ